MTDNIKLCRWIKDNITSSTDALLKKSIDDIMNEVTKKNDKIVSESQYQKYVSMDLISPDALRLEDSKAIDRSSINAEIVFNLLERIKEYVAEATKRRYIWMHRKNMMMALRKSMMNY